MSVKPPTQSDVKAIAAELGMTTKRRRRRRVYGLYEPVGGSL